MPSKFSKTKKSSKSKELVDRFSLHVDDEFHWLDYKFTIFFSFLLAGIYVISSFFYRNGFLELSSETINQYALNNYLVLTDLNESYRLLSSLLIHAHIFHLAGNILFFVIFSIRLEELRGWHIAALIFLISGIAGNLLTLFIFGANQGLWSLGASGGVNGLFAATLVAMRKNYDKGLLSVLFFIIFFASFTIAGPNTNFFAHFGGLIGGGLFIYVLDEYIDKDL